MAEKAIFTLEVNTGNSAKDVEQTQKSLDGFTKSMNDAQREAKDGIGGDDVQRRFDELKAKIDAGGMSVREYSKTIKQLQGIALEAGRTSPIGQQAIKEAAVMRDRLTDLNNEITRNAHDGKNMQAALQLGSTVVAGYGAAQGAMALLGNESEDLQKQLVKLQAATATLNGIEQIRKNLEKESFLMMKAKSLATNVLTASTAAYTAVVGGASGALKIFRLALAATGIGAIIVGLGLLIANFDKVTDALKQAYHWFQNLGMGVKVAISIMLPMIGVINGIMWGLQKLGIIEGEQEMARRKQHAAEVARQVERRKAAEAEIESINRSIANHQEATKEISARYDHEIALIQAAGGNSMQMEGEKLEALKKRLAEEIQLLNDRYEQERILVENSYTFDGSKITAMIQANQTKRAIKSKEGELLAIERQQEVHETKMTKAATDAAKARAKDMEAENKALRDLTIKNIEDTYLREKAAEQARYEDAVKAAKGNKAMLEQVEVEHERNITKIRNDEQARRDAERLRFEHAELEAAKALEDAEKARVESLNKWKAEQDAIALKNKEEAEKISAERLQKIEQWKVDSIRQGFEAIAALSEQFAGKSEKSQRRAFNITKAANMAIASMDTVMAAQKAFSSQIIPGDPTSIIRAGVAAALATAVGVARVAQIAKQQFGGSTQMTGSASGISKLATVQGGGGEAMRGNQTDPTTVMSGGGGNPIVSVVEIMQTQGRLTRVDERSTI